MLVLLQNQGQSAAESLESDSICAAVNEKPPILLCFEVMFEPTEMHVTDAEVLYLSGQAPSIPSMQEHAQKDKCVRVYSYSSCLLSMRYAKTPSVSPAQRSSFAKQSSSMV